LAAAEEFFNDLESKVKARVVVERGPTPRRTGTEPKPPTEDEFRDDFEKALDGLVDSLEENGIRGRFAMDIVAAYSATRIRKPRASILYSALLVTTVGACEVFLGDIMRTFLTLRPEAMNASEAKFSFSEVARFRSIRAFRDYSINKQVDSILRQGSFDDWMKWFDDKLRIRYEELTSSGLAIREVFQRRHVHVHNDGRVSDLYLLKLPDLPDPPRLDRYLEVTPEYLVSTVDLLRNFAIVLTTMIGRKLFRKTNEEKEQLNNLAVGMIYDFLRAAKFDCVVELADRLESGFGTESDRLIIKVNRWIARSRIGDDRVRAEVEAWDASTLHPRYQLAKLALLGNLADAAKLAGQLIEQGQLTHKEYREWPLLDQVREQFPAPPDGSALQWG
jgi:hypothetical protein